MRKIIIHVDGSVTFQKTSTFAPIIKHFQNYNKWKQSEWFTIHATVVDETSGAYLPMGLKNGKTIASTLAVPTFVTKKVGVKIDSDTALPPARPNFLFGADPEGFVVNAAGVAVAPTFIPGTKYEPHKVDGGAIQRDGMAAEFNVDAAPTFAEWNSNFDKVMKALDGFLPEGHKMSWVPAVEFTPEVFDNAPDDYKELGCSPDWNAWEENVNSPPHCEDKPYLRTASGHIHIGWGKDYSLDDALHQRNCFDFVKQLDWYLGGWSLKHDSDPLRRALYGKAGACRLKTYGVEYRVLSNFWITSEGKRRAVWNRMQLAIKAMEERFMPERAPEGYNDKLIEAINTGKMEDDFRKSCRFPLQTIVANYATF